jgi:hypothetical protein
MRGFKAAFEMSMAQYQSRCRIRAAFEQLRRPDSNVKAVAAAVGYHSRKNFYRALRLETGLTPSQVRQLSDEDASRIAEDRLRLPRPGCGGLYVAGSRTTSQPTAADTGTRRRSPTRRRRSAG